MFVKIKKADAASDVVKSVGKRVAIGIGVGGAAGGFAGHRMAKRKALSEDLAGKKTKITTRSGILGGMYLGGLTGLMHGTYAPHLDAKNVRSVKRHWESVGHKFKDRHEDLVGAGAGALGYGALGHHVGKKNEKAKDPSKRSDRWGGAVAMGALGAAHGHMFGSMLRGSRLMSHQARIPRGASHKTDDSGNFDFGAAKAEDVPTPKWARGAKTKADAKTRYRAEAMKNHPDRGGNAEKMKDINTEWEKWEKSPGFNKLSHVLLGLIDELEKLGVKLPSALTAPPPHQMPVVSHPKTPIRGKITISPMMEQGSASATGPQSTDPMV
jgi:hypothetical protein